MTDDPTFTEQQTFTTRDVGHMFAVPPWIIDGSIAKPRLLTRERFHWWRIVRRADRRARRAEVTAR